jgi:CubicO group peptidase (beta-lactamase class C family)
MQDWNVPGLALAIVKDDAVIYSQGFGKRNVARNLDVTSRTLFAIASCTKSFTATALGTLVDEGKLDWDTPIKHYIPWFKLYDAFATERITTRDLLTHRSGLPRHDLLWYNSSSSRRELVERLQFLEPNKDLRYEWQYSNLMYALAGYLCEVITGQRWEDFIQQRLLTPLGMTNSATSARDAQQCADFALPYEEVDGEIREGKFAELNATAPAGSIFSSGEEMTQWLLLQLNKGKHGTTQLISESQMAQLHRPHIPGPDIQSVDGLTFSSYALGWRAASYKGHRVIQHAGGTDGFSSLMTVFPDDRIGVVVLTNKDRCYAPLPITLTACDRLLGLEETRWNEQVKQGYASMMKMLTAQVQHTPKRVSGTSPSHPQAAYTGQFAHPGYGIASVQQDGDQLTFTYNGRTFPLVHYHFDTFEIEGLLDNESLTKMYLSFTTNVEGEIESLAAKLEPQVKAIVFTRVADVQRQEEDGE